MPNLFDLVWTAWAVSWIVAAFWTSADAERFALRRTWFPYGLIALSIVVPLVWNLAHAPAPRLFALAPTAYVGFALTTLPGFAFAWWARLHLGKLWSPAITRKDAHRVVESGPYALVRHPIYTGLLWAALWTDLAGASLPALVSFAALYSGFFLKARDEETFLCANLDERSYRDYRARVPMLIPGRPLTSP